MALSQAERRQFVRLAGKLTWPVPSDVFGAYCRNFITNPFELVVFDRRGRVLLVWRNDEWFTGWNVPGTVILPGDTIRSASRRLVASEVGTRISRPAFVAVMEFSRRRHKRGQEISLLHACRLKGNSYRGKGRFFSFTQLPRPLYPTHLILIRRAVQWLKTGG